MTQDFHPAPGAVGDLDLLRVGVAGNVAQRLPNRPGKRNAVNDWLLLQLEFAMNNLPVLCRPWCCRAWATTSAPGWTCLR